MDALDQLAALEPACSRQQAATFFASLPPARAEAITGRWRGRELATGHPWDGLLSAAGWYGKQFDGPEAVHPLLLRDPSGQVFPVDPRWVPLGLARRVSPALVGRGRGLLGLVRPAVRAHGYGARLRHLEDHGVVTAAMIYDDLPIIDVFRQVAEDTLIGRMDYRAEPAPLFFVLSRDGNDEW